MPIYKKVNKRFFKKWSDDMAYVLGFFAADGGITINNRGGYYIDLHICDGNLLCKIRKALESDHKISKRKWKETESVIYRLQIGSRDMCEDLIKLGFNAQKTHHMPFPAVPKKYIGSFVRGYFDGDGHVWSGLIHKNRKSPMMTLQIGFTSCSVIFLKNLKDTLEKYFHTGGSLIKIANKEAYCLKYSIRDGILLYSLMYDNLQSGLLLERKKKIFDKYLSNRK